MVAGLGSLGGEVFSHVGRLRTHGLLVRRVEWWLAVHVPFPQILNHGERRRLPGGTRVGGCDHEICEFGLALVEEHLEILARSFVLWLAGLDAVGVRHGILGLVC